MRHRESGRRHHLQAGLFVSLLLFSSSTLLAQIPPGYYSTVDTSSPAALRTTLHEVIDDHVRFPYTDVNTDTWDILELAQEDPNNPNNIIDVYLNASYPKAGGGNTNYNREHSWPKSYGFPVLDDFNYPYTDCHHLWLSNDTYNTVRSNKPYRFCNAGCTEEPTLVNGGRGGGSGVYPGNSNWTIGDFSFGTWETWNARKGDVARSILYMDIRYEGGFHGVTGAAEPDLRLTDDDVLIDSFRTTVNSSVAYMGILTDLLEWHRMDPPDADEQRRNDVVFSFQGNRNPFIDHPEWVDCIYSSICNGGPPDTTPPAAPTGLTATGGAGFVSLAWTANTETDLAGYNVQRATSAAGPFSQINSGLVTATTFSDTAVVGGTTYFYTVTAVDLSGNESGASASASATPDAGGGGAPGSVLLSEVFYDASGADDGLEWVELFNPGDTAVDLAGFSLGNGGTDYTTSKVQLSGTIAPGATFVVGGPLSSGLNGNPVFDLAVNFSPDFQNSGTAADGVALFDVPALQVTATTIPVDAVIYGPVNSSGLIDETGTAPAPHVGDASPGASIERIDLAGSWAVQPAPTPNSSPLGAPPPGGNTAPSVTILSPADGSSFLSGSSVTLSGSASDAEDGDLSGLISWSSSLDGALGSGASLTTTTLSVGTHVLTASVTDSGGLSASASVTVTINAPTGNTAPTVTITSPGSGSTFQQGDRVRLRASANDAEDGGLSNAIVWSSSLDGALGSGSQINTRNLSVGTHTITASVTDSGGLSASDSITVTITVN